MPECWLFMVVGGVAKIFWEGCGGANFFCGEVEFFFQGYGGKKIMEVETFGRRLQTFVWGGADALCG